MKPHASEGHSERLAGRMTTRSSRTSGVISARPADEFVPGGAGEELRRRVDVLRSGVSRVAMVAGPVHATSAKIRRVEEG